MHTVRPHAHIPRFLRYAGKVEEPQKVVCNNQYTGTEERWRRERYDRPCVREILQVDEVGQHREERIV
jgi:hypothetical protein